jgi:hypothetical protein
VKNDMREGEATPTGGFEKASKTGTSLSCNERCLAAKGEDDHIWIVRLAPLQVKRFLYLSSFGPPSMLARCLLARSSLEPGGVQADEMKYPNWKGQWRAVNPGLEGQIIKLTT